MAENPLRIVQSDNGLSVRFELTAHYVSDEDAQRIRDYIDQLTAENNELRKLCVELWRSCPVSDSDCSYCKHGGPKGIIDCDLRDTMHKLYIEVGGDNDAS